MSNLPFTDEKRLKLVTYSPREIIDADQDCLLGAATKDFDGILSPSLEEVTSVDLVKVMTDQQVAELLSYLS